MLMLCRVVSAVELKPSFVIFVFMFQAKFTLWDGKPLTGHLCCSGQRLLGQVS